MSWGFRDWSIRKKLLCGFGIMTAILLIVGIAGVAVVVKAKHFANVEMASSADASDGSMESRIKYLEAIWGILDSAHNQDEKRREEAFKRIESAKARFGENLALVKKSGIVTESRVAEIEANFRDLMAKGDELIKANEGAWEVMEKLDDSVTRFIDSGISAGMGARDVHTTWEFAMAANDYAAYKTEELKKDLVEAEREFREKVTFKSGLKGVVVANAEDLVKKSEKILALTDEFGTLAHRLDNAMVQIDEGGAGIEGADAFARRTTEDMKTFANSAMGIIGVSVIAGLTLGVLVAIVLTSIITRSVNRTLDMVKDLAEGEGDLTKKVEVATRDEFGDMGQWFNTFVKKLHDTISSVSLTTHQLASSSTELSSSSEELSRNAKSQKEQVEQVATAIEQMSSTALSISENTQKAAESAKKAASIAREGGDLVNNTIDVMRQISEEVNNFASTVSTLGDSSKQIGDIINVINDIADQTNLLALNAAIEAARAGEQGRGFAVVADEVRKLAERTSKATKEIADMIKTIQGDTDKAVSNMNTGTRKVGEGVDMVNKAGESLQQIVQMADQVGDMVSHIATAAEEQSTANEQIAKTVESISEITKQSTAGIDETARACSELSRMAEDLRGLVGRFKVNEAEHHAERARRNEPQHKRLKLVANG